MSAHTWHADAASLRRYAEGTLGASASASVEAHLLACGPCRAGLSPASPPTRLDAIWAKVEQTVDDPKRGPVERLLVVLHVPDHTARLVAATPSLRSAWLLSVTAALVFAAAAAQASPRGVLLFLVLAPALPVLGVAAAYSRDGDPTYDVAQAAPYPAFRLLLLRTTAVLVSTVTLAGLAALLLPAAPGLAAAWLLPALALTTVTLALSARVPMAVAAAAVVALWLGAVFATVRASDSTYAAFGLGGQLVCLAATALSLALISGRHRRSAFDLRRPS